MIKIKLLMLTTILSTLTTFCAFAGEWKQDATGWWYDNGDATYENSGWSWIDGNRYYFNPEGYCLINTTTPDGYQVDERGAWTVDGVVQMQEEGEALTDLSPKLRFKRPEGYTLDYKTIDTAKYRKYPMVIMVYDIDYESDIKQKYSEEEAQHVVMEPDYAVMMKLGFTNGYGESSRQLDSGEWSYYIDFGPLGSVTGIAAAYSRLVGGHWHLVVFEGPVNDFDTDAIMNACIQ